MIDQSAQEAALEFEHIRKTPVSLPYDLQGKHYRANSLLAYTLVARRSELVALNVENLAIREDASATAALEMPMNGERATNILSREMIAVGGDLLSKAQIQGWTLTARLDFTRRRRQDGMKPENVGTAFKRIA